MAKDRCGTPFPNIVRDSAHLCAIARLLINDTKRLLETIDALEQARAGGGAPLTTWLRYEVAPPAGRSHLSLPANGASSRKEPPSSPELTYLLCSAGASKGRR